MNPKLIFCCLTYLYLVRGDNMLELLSSASNTFSQQLYQKIALTKSNHVYSPFSIHSALTMTSFGARGETATEMFQTLSLKSLPRYTPHTAYYALLNQLMDVTQVKLYTYNAIFVNPNITIEKAFVNNVKKNHMGLASNFDLAAKGGPDKTINDYVESHTEGLIKNIIPKGTIDSKTVMVLVSTIYFNGSWDARFNQQKTTKQDFQQLGGTKSQVDMMFDKRRVNIKGNVNGADVAELPYLGKRFSLYIVLPQKADGITELETSLSKPGTVETFFEGLVPVEVNLYIPKFKFESAYELNSALMELGMVHAFKPGSANFTGISNVGKVYISDIIHKAIIEVKETGAVASAATFVKARRIAPAYRSSAEIFKADHPFVFFLRDKRTKTILFQGKFSG